MLKQLGCGQGDSSLGGVRAAQKRGGTVYQAHTPWPSAATAAAVSAAFPDGRLTLGLPVVIKVVDYNPDDPEWSREMCEREEAACTAVNGCPWAPQLLWASHTESCSWFVFEALTPDPMNLDDYLASQPELPTETILHIIDQLGAALDDLHNSRGMVHNDLKPAQVCLSRKVLSEPAGSGKPGAPGPASAPLPGVYLVDYGISCAPGTPVIDHGFGGTLIYMDPHLKAEALVRSALAEDPSTGEIALHYKVKSNPQGCYLPAYDFYALGQLLAFILARGNEALHQKVVCMAAAAFHAGNAPQHYAGVRALLGSHPGATKGLLDVLVALLGPMESRPCSYPALQQLLARARMDCRSEPDAKQNWSSISSLLSSGRFCHYDDEVLIGQVEEGEDETDCIAAAAAAAAGCGAAAAGQECPAAAAAAVQQLEQQVRQLQQLQQQVRQLQQRRPLASLRQRIKKTVWCGFKKILRKCTVMLLPCVRLDASRFSADDDSNEQQQQEEEAGAEKPKRSKKRSDQVQQQQQQRQQQQQQQQQECDDSSSSSSSVELKVDSPLSLFELMALLPGQQFDEVVEVQEMLGWLLFSDDH
ncbi:hypothetical protein OEZ86_014077 [Tetradesmus obliquus]|nr:hypothetical protein OEZ86_014077 [Tetradesmus obliquus]